MLLGRSKALIVPDSKLTWVYWKNGKNTQKYEENRNCPELHNS